MMLVGKTDTARKLRPDIAGIEPTHTKIDIFISPHPMTRPACRCARESREMMIGKIANRR